jgi:Ca2+-transporting ATPase
MAVSQGRAIFENIRKFIVYLLSGNAGEILIVTLALLAGSPLPLLPLQILYLNMIGDVFPALALGVGPGDAIHMHRPPRPAKEPLLTRAHWIEILVYGLLIAATVLGAFALALTYLDMGVSRAVTVSFLTLAFARLWHVFNMREQGSRFFRNDVTGNPFVWGALVLGAALLVAATYLPGLSAVLRMVPPGPGGWLLIAVMSLLPWGVVQPIKSARRHRGGSRANTTGA